MDKASASGAGDSRFESWAGHLLVCVNFFLHLEPRLELTLAQTLHCPCGVHSSSEMLFLAAAPKMQNITLVRPRAPIH